MTDTKGTTKSKRQSPAHQKDEDGMRPYIIADLISAAFFLGALLIILWWLS